MTDRPTYRRGDRVATRDEPETPGVVTGRDLDDWEPYVTFPTTDDIGHTYKIPADELVPADR